VQTWSPYTGETDTPQSESQGHAQGHHTVSLDTAGVYDVDSRHYKMTTRTTNY